MRYFCALLTLLFVGGAVVALALMLQVDILGVKPLSTDMAVRPSPDLGNRYAGYLGLLFFCIGSALLSYKHAFGFDHIRK